MSLNPFAWLRRQAAEAVVSGVADGMRAVTPEGAAPPANLDELRALLAEATAPKQLAAKADEVTAEPVETGGRKKKA